jgi:hypothetical protein
MTCEACHQAAATNGKMSIPGVTDCMACHQSIKADSPVIQKLARLQNSDLSWTRVYKLPDLAFFSHQKHVNASVKCEVCHGPVKDRDGLWQEKDISMTACVDCHKLRKARLNCDLCHNIGH